MKQRASFKLLTASLSFLLLFSFSLECLSFESLSATQTNTHQNENLATLHCALHVIRYLYQKFQPLTYKQISGCRLKTESIEEPELVGGWLRRQKEPNLCLCPCRCVCSSSSSSAYPPPPCPPVCSSCSPSCPASSVPSPLPPLKQPRKED